MSSIITIVDPTNPRSLAAAGERKYRWFSASTRINPTSSILARKLVKLTDGLTLIDCDRLC